MSVGRGSFPLLKPQDKPGARSCKPPGANQPADRLSPLAPPSVGSPYCGSVHEEAVVQVAPIALRFSTAVPCASMEIPLPALRLTPELMVSLPAGRGQGPGGPGGNADTGETRFSRGGPAGRSPRSDPLTPGRLVARVPAGALSKGGPSFHHLTSAAPPFWNRRPGRVRLQLRLFHTACRTAKLRA